MFVFTSGVFERVLSPHCVTAMIPDVMNVLTNVYAKSQVLRPGYAHIIEILLILLFLLVFSVCCLPA